MKSKSVKSRERTVPLPPLDVQQRYAVAEAAAYLRNSIPKVYQLIHAGKLEAFHEGRRRYITGRSIAAISLPPGA
jgi:excisionase family DNA binding protein